jgi:hypothetical protein
MEKFEKQSRIASINYRVAPEFRNEVTRRYPGLEQGDQEFNYRLMQYLLFAPYHRAADQEFLAPSDLVMRFAGKEPSQNRQKWSTIGKLQEFSNNVLPLDISGYSWEDGKCRTIRPKWSESDYQSIVELRARSNAQAGPRVYFITGKPVTARDEALERRGYQEFVDLCVKGNAPDHPAKEFVDYLNNQPNQTLKRVFLSNKDALYAKLLSLPRETDAERRSFDHTERVLAGIESTDFTLRYIDSRKGRTTRVSALGVNVTQLPREFRKLALRGTTSMDLVSAQLAIIAKLYDARSLRAFLEESLKAERSIWVELLGYLGLDASHKPVLKDAIYALCFGMEDGNLHRLLACGCPDEDERREREAKGEAIVGVGEELAKRFFMHPLIAELTECRTDAREAIKRDGYVVDAFGKEIALQPADKQWVESGGKWRPRFTGGRTPRQAMAAQAQSYEVKIMLALYPVIKAKRLTVACWLHDGIYVIFDDKSRKDASIKTLCRAVEDAADELSIPTRLEYEDI